MTTVSAPPAGGNRQASYDAEIVRAAAAARWPEVIAQLANIDQQLFDGDHHPCPRCGGKDRFRAFTDGTGGAICNQCFRSQNGDGFAVLEWLTGQKFGEVVNRVGELLNCTPSTNGHRRNGKKKADPAEHLEFLDWDDFLVQLWCQKKPPITPAAVQAIGGRRARYRRDYLVIAIPIWGRQLQAAEPVGWILYNTTGQTLPKFRQKVEGKSQPPEWVKVKVTHGSGPGLVGQVDRLAEAKTAWKLEGSTDVLAAASLSPPADVAVVSNAFGCGEEPLPWMVELMAGKQVRVLHDADRPGQDGAMWMGEGDRRRPGWVPHIATRAAEVRNVQLPYPVTPDGGQDVRDWTREASRTWSDLEQLADVAEPYQITSDDAAALETKPIEKIDNCDRLARENLRRYAEANDGATLRYWRQEWYTWKRDRGYRRLGVHELKAKLHATIKSIFDEHHRERLEDTNREDKVPPVQSVSRSLINNVVGSLESLCLVDDDTEMGTWLDGSHGRDCIAMANGILDLAALLDGRPMDEVLLPHSAEWFSTVFLDYDFDPHAKCPTWLETLTENLEGDPERLAIVQEWAGYLLTPDTSYQRFVVLEGDGANGKSVFVNGLQEMLTEPNCSAVGLEQFEKFAISETLGKLLNVDADCGELDRVAEGRLKAFASGERMFFDRKGIPGISVRPTARMVVCTNTRPRIADRSNGIWRRMILIPWRIQIPEERQNSRMGIKGFWRDIGELPGMLRWAIQGLYRLRQQGRFTKSSICQEALDDYKADNNPAATYLFEHLEEGDSYVEAANLYRSYKAWCGDNGHKPVSNRTFGIELKRAFPAIKRQKTPRSIVGGGSREWAYWGVAWQTDL